MGKTGEAHEEEDGRDLRDPPLPPREEAGGKQRVDERDENGKVQAGHRQQVGNPRAGIVVTQFGGKPLGTARHERGEQLAVFVGKLVQDILADARAVFCERHPQAAGPLPHDGGRAGDRPPEAEAVRPKAFPFRFGDLQL